MPKKNNKKLALNSEIKTYQILTKDDEVCIPIPSSIYLAVPCTQKSTWPVTAVGVKVLNNSKMGL
jgi:hypothetical protein